MEDVKINAKEEYLKGAKQKDICTKYNISINTLKSWIKRYKWSEEKKNKGAPKNKRGAPFNIDKKNAEKQVANYEVESVLENAELTEKQRLFCVYYIKSFNATKSAIKAGYSRKTAEQIGYQLLQKASVKSEIQKLKQNKLNRVMLSEDDIFQKYIDIAFADITDYLQFGSKEVEGEYGPYTMSSVNLKDSDEVDGTLISEVSQGKDGIKLKLQDKMKALQWLSDRMDLLPTHTQAKLDLEILKLEIEMNKLDNTEEEVEEDGFIEALDDTAKEVWDDEED
ncbi:terminase small subunit [Terrisporobacter muris]|uniref:Terminase small subunit n=1 Tax=Terrisporobacter muris TaxID=2963284 RepID=A0A9X2RZQ8_9FIRM|nr:terminase small subunit [Terrisporobacter muris]MCR1821278.1 terminase small subunit [Terrisporobacter muris]